MTEVRTFRLIYKDQKPVDISVELGDVVTVKVGTDWYFKGKVKKLTRNRYAEEFGVMPSEERETINLS